MAKFVDIQKIEIEDGPESKTIDIKFTLPDGSTRTLSQSYAILYTALTGGRE